MFGQIVAGILIVIVGYFLVAKSEWLLNNFGRIAWFEQHLGIEGGTRLFYKLLGILIIVMGFMYATGMLQALIKKFFGPLFGVL